MKKALLAHAVVAALTTFGAVSAASAASVTANANVTTDYKFRGISQTNSGPAFQGGFDAAFDNGFYVGNWNSNVSFTGATGAGLEMDFYGGYAGEYKGIGYDVGALYYYYEGATIPAGSPELNTLELYGKLSYAGAYAKVSYAASKDYFGLTAANGSIDQKGSIYTDLGYAYPLNDKITLNAHYGLTSYDKAINNTTVAGTNKSYSDYSLGATYAFDKNYSVTAAYVDTNKKAEQLFGKDATEGSLVVTLSAKF
ncbi:MAG TPA: TorF family putative porin [Limnobacter sp.]|uniref:TorF family putative porin n=1 Tax=Limnobacter sp. TaxID=2003368 RepID=UPI002EDAFDF7